MTWKTIGYRLLGLRYLPKRIHVQLEAEGIRVSITYRDFRAPVRKPS